MLNLNHLPPYYGPRMQTRMLERSQKYAWRGTSLDIRTYGRALMSSDLVLEVRGLPPRRARGRKVRRGRVFGRDAVAVVRTVEREHKRVIT